MNLVLFAFLILGGLGLVFGGVLAFASRVFAVEVDPREEPLPAVCPAPTAAAAAIPLRRLCRRRGEGGGPRRTSAPPARRRGRPDRGDHGRGGRQARKAHRTVRCRGSLDRCKLRFDYDGPGTARARRWWPPPRRPAR